MHFAIIGNKTFFEWETWNLSASFSWINKKTVCITSTYADVHSIEKILPKLSQVIKRGTVVDDIGETCSSIAVWRIKLLGVQTKEIGMQLKKEIAAVKRFKILDLIHTDIEVKEEGTEIIKLWTKRGIVQGWQPIDVYETVDFGKPVRGMHIGMMPAKLTLLLINIALALLPPWQGRACPVSTAGCPEGGGFTTIWDPFCGFGTTGFLVNRLWYNFMGSDKNITSAKQNRKRREKNLFATAEAKARLFKHDVTEKIDQPFLQAVDCIVTEGRLWPVISRRTHETDLQKNKTLIWSVYKSFFEHCVSYFTKPIVLVCTIPVYIQKDIHFLPELTAYAKQKGWSCEIIPHLYKRPKQEVGRQIVVITFWK